jgi:hypothetical protein
VGGIGEAEKSGGPTQSKTVIARQGKFKPGPEAWPINKRDGDRIEPGEAAEHLLAHPRERCAIGLGGQAGERVGVNTGTKPRWLCTAENEDIDRGVGGDGCNRAVEFPQPDEVEDIHRLAREIEPERRSARLSGQPDVVGLDPHAPSLVRDAESSRISGLWSTRIAVPRTVSPYNTGHP